MEIGGLIKQTKQLICTLPKIEIDKDPNEVIIVASIKLVGKVISKHIIKKQHAINTLKRAWDLEGDYHILVIDYHKNIYSFSFTSPRDRDTIWEKRIWNINHAFLVLRE